MALRNLDNPDEAFAALLAQLFEALGGVPADDIKIARDDGSAPVALRPAGRSEAGAFSDIGSAVQNQQSILESLGIDPQPAAAKPKPRRPHKTPAGLTGFTDNAVTKEMVAFAKNVLHHDGDAIGTQYNGGVMTAKNGQKYEVVAVREIHTDDHTTGGTGKVIDHPGITLYFKKQADKSAAGSAIG